MMRWLPKLLNKYQFYMRLEECRIISNLQSYSDYCYDRIIDHKSSYRFYHKLYYITWSKFGCYWFFWPSEIPINIVLAARKLNAGKEHLFVTPQEAQEHYGQHLPK